MPDRAVGEVEDAGRDVGDDEPAWRRSRRRPTTVAPEDQVREERLQVHRVHPHVPRSPRIAVKQVLARRSGQGYRSPRPGVAGPPSRGGSRVGQRVGVAPVRAVAVVVVLAAVAAACGSRLPDDVLADIDARPRRARPAPRPTAAPTATRPPPPTGRPSPTAGAEHDRRGRRPAARAASTGGGRPDGGTGGAAGCVPAAGATAKGVTATEIKVGVDRHRVGPAARRDRGLLPRRAGLLRQGQRRGRRVRPQDHARSRATTGSTRSGPAASSSASSRRCSRWSAASPWPTPGFGDLVQSTRRPLRRARWSTRPAARPPCSPRWPPACTHTGPFQYYRNAYPQRAERGVPVRRRRRRAGQHADRRARPSSASASTSSTTRA